MPSADRQSSYSMRRFYSRRIMLRAFTFRAFIRVWTTLFSTCCWNPLSRVPTDIRLNMLHRTTREWRSCAPSSIGLHRTGQRLNEWVSHSSTCTRLCPIPCPDAYSQSRICTFMWVSGMAVQSSHQWRRRLLFKSTGDIDDDETAFYGNRIQPGKDVKCPIVVRSMSEWGVTLSPRT